MTPVVWVTYRDDVPARGYWDQGLVEHLLTGKLWPTVPFEHYQGFGFDLDGAIVVIPGESHAAHVDELNADLALLSWVLLIVTTDESSSFPWRDVVHPNLRMWIQNPHPAKHSDCPGRFLTEGFPAATPGVVANLDRVERDLDWVFAGQITHRRRKAMASALEHLPNGELLGTAGFAQGLPHAAYLQRLRRAKLAPCPGGPLTPDTFRIWEALEAGAVPIVDAHAGEHDRPGYWRFFDPPPFPIIGDWSDLPEIAARVLADWEMTAARCQAWWRQQKRSLANNLRADLAHLGAPLPPAPQITVVVPTSPIPSHPDNGIIDETVASIDVDAEIMVLCDGVRYEQRDRAADYGSYLERLCSTGVTPLVFDTHTHQAGMLRAALDLIDTPLILFVEHDTPLCGEIPWDDMADALLHGRADLIRLYHEAQVPDPHRHLMLDRTMVGEVPVLRTIQWSQRPHLARTDWYRQILAEHFKPTERFMVEDRMHSVVAVHADQHGREAAWSRYKLCIYAPGDPGGWKRSEHLDGRGADEKWVDR